MAKWQLNFQNQMRNRDQDQSQDILNAKTYTIVLKLQTKKCQTNLSMSYRDESYVRAPK